MKELLIKLLGNKDHLGRRYLIFLIGSLIVSFGVASTTKAGLGTSPICSIPYALSLIITKISFGNWLVIFCFMQIVVQIILLRKNCVVSELIMQVVLAFVYGYLTDFFMFLLKGIQLDFYLLKIIFLLIGCFMLALGVSMQLLAGVVMLSGDAFIRAIAQVAHKPYGNIKMISDISMSIFAAILCVVFLGELVGVREGTVIAALIVGMLVKFCQLKIKNPVLHFIQGPV